MVFDAVSVSVRSLLNPDLTASWEKGLSYVAEGSIEPQEYMDKLETFVKSRVAAVRQVHNENQMTALYQRAAAFYKMPRSSEKNTKSSSVRSRSTTKK